MRLAILSTALVLGSVLAAVAQTSASRTKPDVPYVPTPPEIVRAMLVTARVSPNDVVLDLGCGDGRIVIIAAQEFGARGVGVEIDSRLVRQARANAQAAGVEDRVAIWQEDLFAVDPRPATVVTLYLSRTVNVRLRPNLLRRLRAGTRIVSHNVDMGSWTATSIDELSGHRIYLWIVPPKPWSLPLTESVPSRREDAKRRH